MSKCHSYIINMIKCKGLNRERSGYEVQNRTRNLFRNNEKEDCLRTPVNMESQTRLGQDMHVPRHER
jgi:hypothetical protein